MQRILELVVTVTVAVAVAFATSDPMLRPDATVTMIVSTVDGKLHGIDNNMQRVWTTSTGDALLSSYNTKERSSGSEEESYAVLPSVDGSMIYFNKEGGMQKTSVTARMLNENAPFVSSEGLVFTSRRSTRLVCLDVSNGHVLGDLPPDVERFDQRIKSRSFKALTSPEMQNVWLSRVDYDMEARHALNSKLAFVVNYSDISLLDDFDYADGRSGVLAKHTDTHKLLTGGPLWNEMGSPVGAESLAGNQRLVSTPDGELFYTDAIGEPITGVVELNSVALKAFMIKSQASHMTPNGPDSSIKTLKIFHRMYSLNATEKGSKSVLILQQQTGDGDERTAGLFSRSRRGMFALEVGMDSLADADTPVVGMGRPLSLGMPESGVGVSNYGVSKIGDFSDGSVTLALEEGAGRVRGIQHDRNKQTHNNLKLKQGPVLPNLRRSRKAGFHSSMISSLSETDADFRYQDSTLLMAVDGTSSLIYDVKEDDDQAQHFPSSSSLKVGRYNIEPEAYDGDLFNPRLMIGSSIRSQRIDWAKSNTINADKETGTTSSSIPHIINGAASTLIVNGIIFICMLFIVSIVLVLNLMRASKHYSKYLPLSSVDQLLLVGGWILGFLRIMFIERQVSPFSENILQAFEESTIRRGVGNKRPEQREGERERGEGDERNHTMLRSRSESIVVEYDGAGKKVSKIGSLVIHEKVLGYGSHGTVVFKGSLNGRPVAVKRMLSQFNRSAEREISLLIRSDGHPNVVRYFFKEQKSDFVYLALQLCQMSLK
jgi:hypothetical protein